MDPKDLFDAVARGDVDTVCKCLEAGLSIEQRDVCKYTTSYNIHRTVISCFILCTLTPSGKVLVGHHSKHNTAKLHVAPNKHALS